MEYDSRIEFEGKCRQRIRIQNDRTPVVKILVLEPERNVLGGQGGNGKRSAYSGLYGIAIDPNAIGLSAILKL